MKKIISLLMVLALLFALQLPAAASSGYVFDQADILSEEDEIALDQFAEEYSQYADCGIYFVSVDNFEDYDDSGAYEAAKEIFLDWELGYGDDGSGVLLLMSMSNRKMALIAHGYGNAGITDDRNQEIRSSIKPAFKSDNWAEGVEIYIQMAGEAISEARADGVTEADVVTYTSAPLGYRIAAIVVLFLLAMLVAFLVTLGLKGQLKSVEAKTEAMDYTGPNDLHLTVEEDVFLHTTTQRVYSPEKSEDSDSGGTSVDSGGFSGSDDDF